MANLEKLKRRAAIRRRASEHIYKPESITVVKKSEDKERKKPEK
jgi:hypothetical protein